MSTRMETRVGPTPQHWDRLYFHSLGHNFRFTNINIFGLGRYVLVAFFKNSMNEINKRRTCCRVITW